MDDDASLRPNVGIALFDRTGRVLIARRTGDDGPEVVEPGFEWQMPQGGIEAGEDIETAARRELAEETGVTSATLLAVLPERLDYLWPPYHGPPHRLSRWRGQRQAWLAFRFTGAESEIDLSHAAPGEAPEFDLWRWERLDYVAGLVVSYKRAVYMQVARGFARFTAQHA
jgi:putative (di)nucleoside polyphosphate hydrolase